MQINEQKRKSVRQMTAIDIEKWGKKTEKSPHPPEKKQTNPNKTLLKDLGKIWETTNERILRLMLMIL